MAIVPIDLPFGMMRNGTPYAARGRWVDGNLVRWHDGALRPIGGWSSILDGALSPVQLPMSGVGGVSVYRDAISYRTLLGLQEAVFFSNNSVQRFDSGRNVDDITPVGYFQGSSQPSQLTGYGVGLYGVEPYGVRRTSQNIQSTPVDRVSSDMWGEDVLFAMDNQGPLYIYEAGTLQATQLGNAPVDMASFVVTNERIVMGIRNSVELREVIWSDRENNNEWTETEANYAGSIPLQGTGRLVGIYNVLNQQLILSETDAHVSTYRGAPFVYGFTRVGANCGPIWKSAVATTDRFAIWLGARNFWIYDGTLRPLPCEVADYVYGDLAKDHVSKIHTLTNSDFSEIWWFYQSQGSTTGDVDSYVVFDYIEKHWATGKLERTVGFDRGTYAYPVMVAPDGTLYNHELTDVKVDGTAFAMTGPLELNKGQRNMAVRYVLPDTQDVDSVELEFYTRQLPTAPDVMHGPYAFNNPISTTGVLGREIRMKAVGLTNNWEVGTMRFDVQEAGGGFR